MAKRDFKDRDEKRRSDYYNDRDGDRSDNRQDTHSDNRNRSNDPQNDRRDGYRDDRQPVRPSSDLGGMWEKEDKNGNVFFSVELNMLEVHNYMDREDIGPDSKINVLVFLNKFKDQGTNRPDFKLFGVDLSRQRDRNDNRDRRPDNRENRR